MKKICFLHTNQDLVNHVGSLIPQIAVNADITCVRAPAFADIAEYAHQVMREGASVIVARGLEASVLRNTGYPVVEITMTIPEFIDLIQEAKKLVSRKSPVIAVIGFAGSYHKLASLQKLMNVRIIEYLIEDVNNYDRYRDLVRQYVDEAIKRGADCVLGGQSASAYASERGLPGLFTSSSIDSIREAFQTACMIAAAVEEEKRKNAEFKAVVNNSFNGIVKLDKNGRIVLVNYIAENFLGASSSALEGKPLAEVLAVPRGECNIDEILASGKSYHSILIPREGMTLVTNLAPIMVDGSIEGVIVSLEELQKMEKDHAALYKNLYAGTFAVSVTFEQQVSRSPVMATVIWQAHIYARYDTSILITGEIGSGKKVLAQCIHNASARRNGAFVAVDCSTMPPEALDRLLYGTNETGREYAGLLRIANDGTLYLGNVSALDMYAQQKLAGVLSDNTYFDPNTGYPVTLVSRVRLICASRQDLSALVAQGKFSPALYCALQTLTLHVPALRERQDDIWELAQRYILEFSARHKKYVHLEEEVLEVLRGFSWPGNIYQLSKYCERLVVLTDGGSINTGIAEQLLPTWGERYAYDAAAHTISEYDRILYALKLHGGNRNDAAIELGLSKTTLWRRMKQYGIQWQ
jgi:PAS domain S-box-containing protein